MLWMFLVRSLMNKLLQNTKNRNPINVLYNPGLQTEEILHFLKHQLSLQIILLSKEKSKYQTYRNNIKHVFRAFKHGMDLKQTTRTKRQEDRDEALLSVQSTPDNLSALGR